MGFRAVALSIIATQGVRDFLWRYRMPDHPATSSNAWEHGFVGYFAAFCTHAMGAFEGNRRKLSPR